MIVVNTHEAKTQLSRLLVLVAEKHETVRICRNGKVMAELVEPATRRKGKGKFKLKVCNELDGVVFHESPFAQIPEEFFPEAGEE